ncbi:DUF1232 domain-containing protein [Lysobacter sp. TY2-98]|uniref:YkvA family protein n=1 Tax=Lysobacter sp. TY2-98 TaxID=2290922 RepID=UPI000E208998|nr:YkvA family protein [Lysobacter sp. TY2-98]AXK71815.1 DUF1232 domain-containing protein [Lysobacter sp. TY2-98]
MPLTVNIDLSDDDLKHFARAADIARQRGANLTNAQVLSAATDMLTQARNSNPPEYVQDRLVVLERLIAMMGDEGWALGEEDAANVRAALVYFASAYDAIHDTIPVLGFLDDAIMIELCARELRHELDAYDDFCEFRDREAERRGLEPGRVGRTDWLDVRRTELQERMRNRRSRDFNGGFGSGFGTGYGSSSGYGPIRPYAPVSRGGSFRFR